MSNNMNLPGYEEAGELGYDLNYHGGDNKSAVYTRLGLNLHIREKDGKLEADLSFVDGFLTVKTPPFSFPNRNFKTFEDSILLAKRRLSDE